MNIMDGCTADFSFRHIDMNYTELLSKIHESDKLIYRECETKWNSVAKPLKSLGIMEELVSTAGAAQKKVVPSIEKRRVLVFCADNGVVEEGVSQTDHTVTTAVAKALVEGTSNVNIMAKKAGADVKVFDVGMIDDVDGLTTVKTSRGTKNFTKAAAMTMDEAVSAIETGAAAVLEGVKEDVGIFVIGEMGIGNTTSTAAVISVLLGEDPSIIAGRGSGLSDAGLQRKINAIRKAIDFNNPDSGDGLDVLSKVGGFDIAAMCGAILAGAAFDVPVILDGVISGAAALVARAIDKRCMDFILPSHMSKEPGGEKVMRSLGIDAPIMAKMALGEGTGGVMLLPLLDLVLSVYDSVHSFDNIGIEAYK